MKLTDLAIKRFNPKDKNYRKFDGEGLYLQITRTGSKLWRKRYRFNKKEKTLSFGKYPLISLIEARNLNRDASKLIAQGIDPMQKKKEDQFKVLDDASNTFFVVAENWFTVKKTKVRLDYATQVWSMLENHLLPKISSIAISNITAPLLISALEDVKQKEILESLRRLIQTINEIMTFAVNTGLILANPASGIKDAFPSPTSKNMPTIDPEELPELMDMIYNKANIQPLTRYLILWQLHTITRPSEAVEARWEEINFENSEWTIPADRMKKKRIHIIPLSAQVVKLLSSLLLITGNSEYVFPSSIKKSGAMDASTVNMALKRNGFKDRLVAHGFRSIASTVLNNHGFNYDWIEECLAHLPENRVRAAYNKSQYLEQRKEVMQYWSDFISEATKKGLNLA